MGVHGKVCWKGKKGRKEGREKDMGMGMGIDMGWVN